MILLLNLVVDGFWVAKELLKDNPKLYSVVIKI